jgi:hypothetical protein
MLPVEPLRAFLDSFMARRFIGRPELAELLDVDQRTVDRLYDPAVPLVSLGRADRVLAPLGFHVSHVWPRWLWEPEPELVRTIGRGSGRGRSVRRTRLAS